MANSPYLYGGGLPKAPAAKPKPKPVKKPAASKVVVSQPVRKQSPAGTSAAQQIVNAALAPLLANIKAQQASLGSNQAAQQAALQGYTKNIIDYLKGAPTAIQSDYQGAVDTTQNLAQASADQLLKANPNSLNQADLAAINAPQAQRDALAAQNQNVYGGGSAVLFKTAGAIPATAFAEDKANAQAFADSLPSIQGLQGQQLFAKLLASQNEDTQKLEAQKAEVLAKGPGLLQQAQNSLAPTSAKAPTTRKIGDGYYEWNPSKGWVLLAKTSATDRSGQVKLANGQYVTTLNGNPIGRPWGPVKTASAKGGSSVPHTTVFNGKKWQWNPSTQSWGLLGTSGSSTGAGKTVSGKYTGGTGAYGVLNGMTTTSAKKTILKWKSDAGQSARAAATSAQSGQTINGEQFTYQKAVSYMLGEGIPLDVAQKALNRYWKPGEDKKFEKPGEGRPKASFQKRNPNMASPKMGGAAANSTVGSAIRAATAQIGLPYVFGSESPGKSFDCSGLIQYAYKQAGINISRDTFHQIHDGFEVNWRSASDLRPGDLIFPSPHHVVMYVGNGQVVAAPHTGTTVQNQPVSAFLGKGTRVRRIVRNGLV